MGFCRRRPERIGVTGWAVWGGGACASVVRDRLAMASAAVHRVITEARGWVGSFIYCWLDGVES